tara:strand:- start:409 stop:783 length:375 start_codon:yes stop_codon:yes gene_type:complete
MVGAFDLAWNLLKELQPAPNVTPSEMGKPEEDLKWYDEWQRMKEMYTPRGTRAKPRVEGLEEVEEQGPARREAPIPEPSMREMEAMGPPLPDPRVPGAVDPLPPMAASEPLGRRVAKSRQILVR